MAQPCAPTDGLRRARLPLWSRRAPLVLVEARKSLAQIKLPVEQK